MLEAFIATLNPMLMLFICIAIGFALMKTKILPENSGVTIAKLETWVFCPAVSFITMAKYCTVSVLIDNLQIILISCVVVLAAVIIAIFLSRLFVKEKITERGIYQYALAFANFGYLGEPLVLAMFGDEMLFYYKLFTLPLYILVYTWGLSVIIPSGEKQNPFKKLLTPPLIAMFLGIAVGLLGLEPYFPEFISSTLDSLKTCMGPLAMVLAGITVARFNVKEMLSSKKVYIATALRLFVLPAVCVGLAYAILAVSKELFGTEIDNKIIYLTLIAYAGPLGLNTVVFPEAYGGNPKTGAAMAMISHTLCVITIPLMYALLTLIFDSPLII